MAEVDCSVVMWERKTDRGASVRVKVVVAALAVVLVVVVVISRGTIVSLKGASAGMLSWTGDAAAAMAPSLVWKGGGLLTNQLSIAGRDFAKLPKGSMKGWPGVKARRLNDSRLPSARTGRCARCSLRLAWQYIRLDIGVAR